MPKGVFCVHLKWYVKKTFRRKNQMYKKKTWEEKQQEVEQLFEVLYEGVSNFHMNPEKFKALLETQALFPNYSFRNTVLILKQCRHATYVASFKRFKELERTVKKGEQAIRILAPRIKKEQDEVTGEEKHKIYGFISVPVFDVTQTEGKPLPIDEFKLVLTGQSEVAEQLFEGVKQLAIKDNCPIRIDKCKGANGYYNFVDHEIVVGDHLDVNHRTKTAVHELVHSRVHTYEELKKNQPSESERECVAEGAAFVVCSYFGLDTSEYSFEYVRGWAGKNVEEILHFGSQIQRVASTIIHELEELTETEHTPTDEKELVTI